MCSSIISVRVRGHGISDTSRNTPLQGLGSEGLRDPHGTIPEISITTRKQGMFSLLPGGAITILKIYESMGRINYPINMKLKITSLYIFVTSQ